MKRPLLALVAALWASGLNAGVLDILTDTRLGDKRRVALEEAVKDAERWLENQTGRKIEGEFVVLGGDRRSLSQVLDVGFKRLNKPRPPVPDIANLICNGRQPNALANPDFILVCWPLASGPENPRALRALMVHELFHHMQYDLSRSRQDRPGPRQRRLGPAWMVEGTAEVLEMLYVLGTLPDEGRNLFALQNPARRSRLTLDELSNPGTVTGFYGYGTSRFAASLLVRAHGLEKTMQYFRWLGRGLSQEVAFAQTFGQSMSAFEEEFELLRRDYGAARDWQPKK